MLRRALGEFATGVAVVTAQDPDIGPVGITMNSFNSVSIDPPLVLFSLDRRSRILSAMLNARGFAVNILARDQEDASIRFARRSDDKWDRVTTVPGYAGAPLIDGALAHFECAPYANYDGGDHVIFVVEVLRHSMHPSRPAPLIFFRGRYRDIDAQFLHEPSWPLSMHY